MSMYLLKDTNYLGVTGIQEKKVAFVYMFAIILIVVLLTSAIHLKGLRKCG